MSRMGRTFRAANQAFAGLPGFVRVPILAGATRFPYERRLPRFLMIEPTNSCNLSCPLCPVGARVMTRKHAFMDVDCYRTLIGEVSGFVRRIVMNFAGETFLHPRIAEMTRIAESKGIAVTLGTNGTIDRSKEILEAVPTEILFALDGITQESYAEYRRGGNLAHVLENLGRLTEGRRKLGSKKPRIILQFVVMRHNEGEIDGLFRLAEAYGVDEVALTPVIVNDFFRETHQRLLDRYLPRESQYRQYGTDHGAVSQNKPVFCPWTFQSMVLANGDVAACCFDYDGTSVIGNVFRNGFLPVWRSPEYRRLRADIIRQKLGICGTCGFSCVKPVRIPINGRPAA